MTGRPVQVSMDAQLLRRIDADPQTRREGRSAFLRAAAELYLETRRRQTTDAALRRAFSGAADEMLAEVEDLMGTQAGRTEGLIAELSVRLPRHRPPGQ